MSMYKIKAITMTAMLLLAACGGGTEGSAPAVQSVGGSPPPPSDIEKEQVPPTTYSVGGTLSGISGQEVITLKNNGGDDLTIGANQTAPSFVFTAKVSGRYNVTIKTAVEGKLCSVINGSGTATADVTNVEVTCTEIVVSGTTLKTAGAQLRDAAGKPIVLRGVNVPVYKSGWQNDLTRTVSAVQTSKANAVRIVWWSTPPAGTTEFTLANFEDAIRTVANAGMLPIVELHDATCFLAVPQASCNDTAIFKTRITDFWTRADVMDVLKKYQGYLVVNLANEWGRLTSESAGADAFIAHYAGVLATVRKAWSAAGLDNIPIMIDAPNGGSYSGVFLEQHASGQSNGRYLINSDPGKNVLLSSHAYWPSSEGHTDTSVSQRLQAMANSGLPFVLGEVGSNANGSCGNTDSVPWRTVMQKASELGLGTMAWAWYEEGCQSMNLTVNKDGFTLPANDGTDDFQHRMVHDPAFGLVPAQAIPSYGLIQYHAMTATINWQMCDGRTPLAEGADYVSNSNCQYGAVTYSGLAEAKTYLDTQPGMSRWPDGIWRRNSDNKRVTDEYLVRTASCYETLKTLQSVGGGLTGNQLYVRASSKTITPVLALTGGKNKDLQALFPYSLGMSAWSCN